MSLIRNKYKGAVIPMKKVYITSNIPDVADELLNEKFEVVKNVENKKLTKKDLIELGNTYDGMITSLTDPFDAEVLSEIKKTKIFDR